MRDIVRCLSSVSNTKMNSDIEIVNTGINLTKLSAEELDCGVRQLGQIIGFCTFQQGAWLKQLRDSKKYSDLDHDSFKSYVSTLDMSRATAYERITNYEFWILGLGLTPESLQDIALNRLQIIKPIAETDPSRWLEEARVLSTSDLINSVREEKGREPMPREEPDHITSFSKKQGSGSSYLEFVRSHGCIFHPNKQSVAAHWPVSKGTGHKAKDHWVIPLCVDCHAHLHDIGDISFLEAYRHQIAEYFYDSVIGRLFDELGQ